MARLEITRKEDARVRSLTPIDFNFKLDGVDIAKSLQRVELSMGVGDANRLILTLLVDDMKVDVDALLELKAVLDEKK